MAITTVKMALMNYNAPNQLVNLVTSCAHQLPANASHSDGSAMETMIVLTELMSLQQSARLIHPKYAEKLNFCVPTATASHNTGVATEWTTAETALMKYNAPNQLVHLATFCAQLPAPASHNDGSAMETMIVLMVLMSLQHSAGLKHPNLYPKHAAAGSSCAATGTASTSHGNVTGTRTAMMALMRLIRNVVGWICFDLFWFLLLFFTQFSATV